MILGVMDVTGLAYPKLRARRTPGDGTIRSDEGLDITCRPGDIFRTSQAKDVGLREQDETFKERY